MVGAKTLEITDEIYELQSWRKKVLRHGNPRKDKNIGQFRILLPLVRQPISNSLMPLPTRMKTSMQSDQVQNGI